MTNEHLTERQQKILKYVIQEYIRTATPISSKTITAYSLGVQAATIRNEMARLEELGYLTHPHTSAGRVPTEAGYRYFVQKLMQQVELPDEEQRMISHQFHQARLELDQWLKLSAAVLAHTSHNASLITAPKSALCHLKHIELISIQDNVVLLILVLQGGMLKQQILSLDNPVEQANLSQLARRLGDLWAGMDANEIASSTTNLLDDLALKVCDLVEDTMRRIDARSSSDVYRDGLLNILNRPDFKNREGIQQIIRVLEEHQVVERLVHEALQQGGVQIIIGGDGKWEEFSDVSIVLARYGVENKVTGAMGVIGPLRMPYSRTVSVVRYMSHLMSNLISDLYGYQKSQ
ncbi:MAG TPA: heat-inducible transcriptional repressor HrcA [Anaerolineae bacterium]|nr:heat-inducible transcriptional repressor HrcA [Anaerolineae bacterium]HMR62535.1 heat-inducible transcriptional repressor HrcA [Anaerolineae bacterium]